MSTLQMVTSSDDMQVRNDHMEDTITSPTSVDKYDALSLTSSGGFSSSASSTAAAATTTVVEDISRTNLFVAGISPDLSDDDLYRLFRPCGPICSCEIVRNPVTCVSRGVAFVQFVDSNGASAAISSMNNVTTEMKGGSFTMRVRYASDPPPHGGSLLPSSRPDADPAATMDTNKLFVRRIPSFASTKRLIAHFSQYGKVTGCVLQKDLSRKGQLEGLGMNMAYVTFQSNEEAERATRAEHIKMPLGENGEIAAGPLIVKLAETLARRNARLAASQCSSSLAYTEVGRVHTSSAIHRFPSCPPPPPPPPPLPSVVGPNQLVVTPPFVTPQPVFLAPPQPATTVLPPQYVSSPQAFHPEYSYPYYQQPHPSFAQVSSHAPISGSLSYSNSWPFASNISIVGNSGHPGLITVPVDSQVHHHQPVYSALPSSAVVYPVPSGVMYPSAETLHIPHNMFVQVSPNTMCC